MSRSPSHRSPLRPPLSPPLQLPFKIDLAHLHTFSSPLVSRSFFSSHLSTLSFHHRRHYSTLSWPMSPRRFLLLTPRLQRLCPLRPSFPLVTPALATITPRFLCPLPSRLHDCLPTSPAFLPRLWAASFVYVFTSALLQAPLCYTPFVQWATDRHAPSPPASNQPNPLTHPFTQNDNRCGLVRINEHSRKSQK